MDARILPITDRRIEDMTGRKFGRLTVAGYAGRNARGGSQWLCECECGSEIISRQRSLQSGSTRSCGCLHSDVVIKHADSNSTEYRTWDSMKRRCYNPRTKHFEHYGGRGIKVCDRWRDSYEAFLEDMGRRPSSKHSLDRIKNDGDYELSNCRWTLQVIQIRNRSIAVTFEWQGRSYSQMELSELSGIPFGTLRSRLKRGWPLDRSMNTPVQVKGHAALAASISS
jgi:hypothetical protein